MTKNTLPSLAVGDSVVVRLDNGDQQSATVVNFSRKNKNSHAMHVYATFAWKTGPRASDVRYLALHSCKWADRVLAVFPKDAKFLAV